jgi:hypothetical protein
VWTSAHWETLGYDRAYEAPTASSHGPFPLVMVSPGYKDGNWEYFYIGTRLASHGYVVAVIDHDHEGQFVWSLPAGDYLVSMFNRPRDVSFAITELLLKNANVGELLHAVIEPSKIAMSGHSFGGYLPAVMTMSAMPWRRESTPRPSLRTYALLHPRIPAFGPSCLWMALRGPCATKSSREYQYPASSWVKRPTILG